MSRSRASQSKKRAPQQSAPQKPAVIGPRTNRVLWGIVLMGCCLGAFEYFGQSPIPFAGKFCAGAALSLALYTKEESSRRQLRVIAVLSSLVILTFAVMFLAVRWNWDHKHPEAFGTLQVAEYVAIVISTLGYWAFAFWVFWKAR